MRFYTALADIAVLGSLLAIPLNAEPSLSARSVNASEVLKAFEEAVDCTSCEVCQICFPHMQLY